MFIIAKVDRYNPIAEVRVDIYMISFPSSNKSLLTTNIKGGFHFNVGR